MSNLIAFYKEENSKILEKYEKGLLTIKDICNETEKLSEVGELKEYYKFFNHTGKFLLKLSDMEKKMNDEYFETKSFEELKKENHELYNELLGDNYNTSYANPSYAVSVFGDEMGQLISTFYERVRTGITYAYKHRVFSLEENNDLLIQLFNSIKAEGIQYEKMKKIVISPLMNGELLTRNFKWNFEEGYTTKFKFYLDIILKSDLNDLRYLFKLGKYISDYEIKTAEFLCKYPQDKIEKLSHSVVEAYKRGFIVENKKRGNRNSVELVYSVGQERIIRQIIKDFKKNSFQCTFESVFSTKPNKQYEYDHKFDKALYFSKEYAKLHEEVFDKVGQQCEGLKAQAGPLIFESFGEIPFSPQKKKECLKVSEEQQKIIQKNRNKVNEIYEKYYPNEESSFCVIALPSPEIGERFEDIFEDTMKINMMDNKLYEEIQQVVIDVLDKGDYVHVKGTEGNETDIKVKLPELKNPDKETNFVNCVADVNIPLGEVFTSPQLKGTEGILHLKDTYLGLRYENLKLTFKDGYVVEYDCSNFDNEKDNKEYVKENLMAFHDKLPLGEFAIGTNTTAYVMAQKYDILDLLPILIIEKMGPHFAIGDTCFSWAEDLPVYNMLDKKEIVARDNEKSILRKEDIDKAYTNVHTDITLPYEEIQFISVISKDGQSIDIIRDGRFVLKGTEVLNEAFDKQ